MALHVSVDVLMHIVPFCRVVDNPNSLFYCGAIDRLFQPVDRTCSTLLHRGVGAHWGICWPAVPMRKTRLQHSL